jgi:O-antigen ligase
MSLLNKVRKLKNKLTSLKAFDWIEYGIYALLIFSVTLQIQIPIVESISTSTGLQSSYMTHFFTLTNAISLVLTSYLFYKKKLSWPFTKKENFIILGILIFLGVSSFNSFNSFSSLHTLPSLAGLFLLFFLFSQKNKINKSKIFIWVMAFQAIIAIFQFITQGSLGLNFLGESNLSSTQASLALFNFDGSNLLRAYGTFPHPNILGGFMSSAILLFFIQKEKMRKLEVLALILCSSALLLSFSRSAILALLITLIIWAINKRFNLRALTIAAFTASMLITLLFIFRPLELESTSIQDRTIILESTLSAIKSHPLGLGLWQSTDHLPLLESQNLHPWQYEPIHNIYLLGLLETGFITTALILLFIGRRLKNSILSNKKSWMLILPILLIGSVDHYFWTISSGQYLALFLIAQSKSQSD